MIMPEKKEIDTKIYESKDKIKARIIADCKLYQEQLEGGENLRIDSHEAIGYISIFVSKKD